MNKRFSKTWKRSVQPRKQRKYRYNSPLHIKQKFVSVHLSKELKTRYNKRSLNVKKGDKIKIMRGRFRSKTGKVEKVDLKKTKVFITGIESVKKDGTKYLVPIHPSNIMITELNIDDKKRDKILKRSESNGKQS